MRRQHGACQSTGQGRCQFVAGDLDGVTSSQIGLGSGNQFFAPTTSQPACSLQSQELLQMHIAALHRLPEQKVCSTFEALRKLSAK